MKQKPYGRSQGEGAEEPGLRTNHCQGFPQNKQMNKEKPTQAQWPED